MSCGRSDLFICFLKDKPYSVTGQRNTFLAYSANRFLFYWPLMHHPTSLPALFVSIIIILRLYRFRNALATRPAVCPRQTHLAISSISETALIIVRYGLWNSSRLSSHQTGIEVLSYNESIESTGSNISFILSALRPLTCKTFCLDSDLSVPLIIFDIRSLCNDFLSASVRFSGLGNCIFRSRCRTRQEPHLEQISRKTFHTACVPPCSIASSSSPETKFPFLPDRLFYR